jgi:hypothetical protein
MSESPGRKTPENHRTPVSGVDSTSAPGGPAMLNAMRNAFIPMIALLSATMILADSGARAAEADSIVVMRPSETVAFDAGPRRIVGVFVVADGQCDLSAVITEAFRDNASEMADEALRIQATLAPGAASSIDAGAGYRLQFACKSGAQTMSATTLSETGVSRGVGQSAAFAETTGRRLAMLRAAGI